MSANGAHVERNREQRERLRSIVARLRDDDLARMVPGSEWSIADTLAHLAFYDRRAQVLLEKYAREGVTASPYDPQTLNDALPHLTRLIPPRAVADEVLAAAEAADAAAAALSPALLEQIRAGSDVNPERAIHRKNHLDDVEPLLDGG